MNKKALAAAAAWAEKEYPNEACGLFAGGTFYPCENSAEDPANDFRISAQEWARVEDIADVTEIVHSHPDQRCNPSESDRASCEALGLPWVILEIREGKFSGESFRLKPSGYEAKLVGREFKHGFHDCLSVILDYYKREMGIELGDYKRDDNWWNNGQDLYRELLPKAGFVRVDGEPLQQGDIILMQIRAPVPNHAAVYLADGIIASEPEHYPSPGCILHHMYGRDSRRDPYGGYWLENTVGVWRYERTTQDS